MLNFSLLVVQLKFEPILIYNKATAKRGISPRLKFDPVTLTLKIDRVPDSLKDIACTKFGQNPLKDVTEGRTDSSVTISLRNFVGEGIIKQQ